MSHSEDEFEKEVKRHKAPLLGFAAILIAVAVFLLWWLGQEVEEPVSPIQMPAEAESSSVVPQMGAPSDSQLIESAAVMTVGQSPLRQ